MTIGNSDDLVLEILLWLPAKSVIRFKLVCKRWLNLISSHQFSNRHILRVRSRPEPCVLLRLAETPDFFYLQNSLYVEKLVPYYFSPAFVGPITIRSFSNGLFLLQCRHVENPLVVFHVYNPTTKQSRKMSLSLDDIYMCVLGLNIAFDPFESPHYKIVCVRAAVRSSAILWRSWWRRCQIEMFDSETNSWKLCGEPFLAPRSLNFDHGVYWKGGIHWRGIFFDFNEGVVKNHPGVVVPGDTGTEKIRHHYTEFNDCLHNIAVFPEKKSIMVFKLQSDYSEWSLKYHINLDEASGPVSVLGMVKGKDEEDSTIVLHEPGKVMAYKLQENCFKELIDFRAEPFYQEGRSQFAFDRSFEFIETLALV